METPLEHPRFQPVSKVLTVPMRNGNISTTFRTYPTSTSSYRTYEEWKLVVPQDVYQTQALVLTVPMRNGNKLLNLRSKSIVQSSYRTYEEWKRFTDDDEFYIYSSSYRTYEEWKPESAWV